MSTIGVVGVGSIGTVLARGFDALGHHVIINDTDPDATTRLDYPAKPKPYLATHADHVIFALPTPTTDNGGDTTSIDQALQSFHDTDATLILRSTMPPGSTMQLAGKHELPLVYSPEFLRDRSGVEDFFTSDRIVLAGPDPERESARQLFEHPRIECETVIETRDYIDAELAKEAHNAFFATKVSFANQMRSICERAGADPELCMNVVTADHRNTSSHLDPMLGPYGGKCLPKDTEALRYFGSEQAGVPTPLLDGTVWMNEIARDTYEHVDIQGSWPDITLAGD